MSTRPPHDAKLARMLILDESFDLSLVQALCGMTDSESQKARISCRA